MWRVGVGWDQHRLVEGRPLILGGERLDHSRGLHGHSDGDVLAHAVGDAILGALGQGDLGRLFPDTEAAHRGADSLQLLAEVARRMREAGYGIENVDTVVVAQEPRLSGRLEAMVVRLAQALGCDAHRVSVKASSPEGIGDLGSGSGIAAHAVVLLRRER